MKYVTIYICDIDYNKLPTEIKPKINHKPKHSKLLDFLLPLSPALEKIPNVLLANQIVKFAAKYGISLMVYIENKKPKNENINERLTNIMYNLSVSVDRIDYQKLIESIRKDSSSKNGSSVFFEILKIITPFAADTMKTIPPKAVADLFMLLGRDKIIEMAKDYGVVLSGLSVTDSMSK
ncbi:MAG: hypothetical protein FWC09_08065 [Lachnospiraceae bacterium]|nr:hypothetical protein [Lachnospiraceae bacterium]